MRNGGPFPDAGDEGTGAAPAAGADTDWLAFTLEAAGARAWEHPLGEGPVDLAALWARLAGEADATAVPRSCLEALRLAVQDLREGRLEQARLDCVARDDRGHERALRVVLRAGPGRTPGSGPTSIRGVSLDRTEARQAEANLARQADTVARASRDFESFSHAIAHEARAPIRAIAGYADLLLSHAGRPLSDDTRRVIERIAREARDLASVVEGLVVLSRHSRAELRPVRLDLELLARDLWRDIRLSDPSHPAVLVMPATPAPAVLADRSLTRAVLRNLLENALKYSRPRTESRVEFGFGESPEPHFFVRDNGVGLDLAAAPRLFEPFARHHPAIEGIGLGLATVRRIVERHGGRVWAESRPGEGAAFRFTLPLAA